MRKATVCVPIAALYATATSESVLQDEILYGMEVSVLEEAKENGMCNVVSFYEYAGFVSSFTLCDGGYPANRVVSAPFAHLMKQTRVDSVQAMRVPKGSFLLCMGETEDGWSQIQPVGSSSILYTKTSWLSKRVTKCPPEEQFRRDVVRTAMSYLHTPYQFGGKTSSGIDCSGLCFMSYLKNGAVIWRDAVKPPKGIVKPISLQQAKPADLLYFPGHMALYLGDARFLHATARAGDDGVCIGSFRKEDKGYRGDLLKSFICAGTIF